jgi:chromosome segregation ATPase
MMRRVKEEHSRQKALNATLQAELDAIRPSSETSSRTRVVNGRITPMSDESHESTLRVQLADAHRQIQRTSAENTDLHKKINALQTEAEQVRVHLSAARHEADERLHQVEDLEAEVDRLETSLRLSRHGKSESLAEQLNNDNAALKRENEVLQQRIGLLLDVDHQPGIPRTGDRPSSSRPISHTGSENFDALSHELGDWLATSSSVHRPLSEYESDAHPQQSLSQLQRTRSP